MQNPDSEVPAATLKQSGGVSSHTHTHVCVCEWDQCQCWHGWMPVCESPERRPGAQQIGTLALLVPPACGCV